MLEKEFKQIKRDRFLPRIIFLLPVIQLMVLPFAANFEMRNINLSIVDNDHTVLSRRLTEKVLSSGYFRLADVSPRYDEALASIESNAADIILEIPSRFEERLGREGTAELLIAANAVNGRRGESAVPTSRPSSRISIRRRVFCPYRPERAESVSRTCSTRI